MDWISRLRARQHARASHHRAALRDLPDGLETAWRHIAPKEYPGIRTDAFFFVLSAEGLLCFFDAATISDRPCALPSDAADSVWHAWRHHDPGGLRRFCREHFNREVPHPGRAGPGAGALAGTLMSSRRLEGMASLGPHLPLLFGLDARLRMPGGHGYWRRGGEIVYARLDSRGRCVGRAQPHRELTAAALLAAGAVKRP